MCVVVLEQHNERNVLAAFMLVFVLEALAHWQTVLSIAAGQANVSVKSFILIPLCPQGRESPTGLRLMCYFAQHLGDQYFAYCCIVVVNCC